jgi:formate/nitrite transporter FocA (FNT family)
MDEGEPDASDTTELDAGENGAGENGGSKRDSHAPSGKLNAHEKGQAAEHSSPRAKVIHEIVRDEGEEELARTTGAIVWSGLAAGLSMGFSFLAMAMIEAALPDAPYRSLIDGFGYSLGFVIAVLGRQELFTESTLTAVLPVFVRRDAKTTLALARFWALVLSANLVGTFIFAGLLSINGLFAESVHAALKEIAHLSVSGPFWPTLVKAVLAGWLIALMVWLLPAAKSARLFVILLLTYVVAIGHFSHIIAGSVEAFYAVLTGDASIGDYIVGFLVPTLIGNTIGGVALVALLNHAPLAPELRD